jgi:hypothetical protein
VKTLVLVTLMTLSTTAALYASQAASTDRAGVEKQLAATEQKISDAFAKRDVAGMKANVADDAVAIDPGGVIPVSEFFKQLPAMDVKLTDVKLSDFKYHWIDANNVVLTYTWTGKGTVAGQPVQSPTIASTLYTKRNGKWLAYFHQETTAAPAPPSSATSKPAAAPGKK